MPEPFGLAGGRRAAHDHHMAGCSARRSGWVAFAIVVAAACADGSNNASPTTPTTRATTTATAQPTTAATTTVTTAATTPPPTIGPTTTSTTAPDTMPPTSSATVPTTDPPVVCDRSRATGLLDESIARARLDPGGGWSDDTDGVAFVDRTRTATEFADRLGYDCVLRVAQRLDDGHERLALIAWNDVRHALVLQATDAPPDGYRTGIVFQLFFEQPSGEWLIDQFAWAATMDGGETIVIDVDDTSTGLTAKSWQLQAPVFEDLPVTTDAERHGIDVLLASGARLVSVAEPASVGYEIGSIQFHTPLALPAIATVGPADLFDPAAPIVADGEHTHRDVGGVTMRVSTGEELPGIVLHEAGWQCDGYGWRITAGWGSPDEVADFAAQVITNSCDSITPGDE